MNCVNVTWLKLWSAEYVNKQIQSRFNHVWIGNHSRCAINPERYVTDGVGSRMVAHLIQPYTNMYGRERKPYNQYKQNMQVISLHMFT